MKKQVTKNMLTDFHQGARRANRFVILTRTWQEGISWIIASIWQPVKERGSGFDESDEDWRCGG